ncbi:hypothetical protein [Pyrodictium abyssi]|uniref:hypothetical protein n=1 Tax=Pyrodictium abyssi TaxID=54256 RepID=UPI0030C6A899
MLGLQGPEHLEAYGYQALTGLVNPLKALEKPKYAAQLRQATENPVCSVARKRRRHVNENHARALLKVLERITGSMCSHRSLDGFLT